MPQVLAVAEKRRAALKRKLLALQTSANERLADAEKKVAKIQGQASKLPNLGEHVEPCSSAFASRARCQMRPLLALALHVQHASGQQRKELVYM